uniref:DUF3615 domain-containing protein n=1 Tax=Leersia perrieri TaxID=77586 RepID=A0A0D9XJ37_9ORYZ
MDSHSSVTRNPKKPLQLEVCHGKSKYFQEHQAILANKEKAGYKHTPHAWRFDYCPPIPEPHPRAATEQQQQKNQISNEEDDNHHHINIMKSALNSYNKANGNLDFEFRRVQRISTIDEFGSSYYHYNFFVLSKTRLVAKLFFVEVDANIQEEHGVRVCCPLSVEDNEFGICYGCEENKNSGLLHPNTGDYIAGRRDIWASMRRYRPCADDDVDFD